MQEPEPFGRDGGEDTPPVPEVVSRCRMGDARSPGDFAHAQRRWATDSDLLHRRFEHHSPQVAVVVTPLGDQILRVASILTMTRSGS